MHTGTRDNVHTGLMPTMVNHGPLDLFSVECDYSLAIDVYPCPTIPHQDKIRVLLYAPMIRFVLGAHGAIESAVAINLSRQLLVGYVPH